MSFRINYDKKKKTDWFSFSFKDFFGFIITLSLVTISLPIVILLGNGPTFFVAHSTPLWLVSFIIISTLLFPIIFLFIPIFFGQLISNQLFLRILYLIEIIGLLFLFIVKHLSNTSINLPFIYFLSVISAIIVLIIFVKYDLIRWFGRDMGYALFLLTLVWFFIFSPSSSLFSFGQGESNLVTSVENPVPITIVVFDEFHTAAILDRNGNIDDVRFPNFGRLAREGVWFQYPLNLNCQSLEIHGY